MSPIRSQNIFKTVKRSFQINRCWYTIGYYRCTYSIFEAMKHVISEGDNSKFLEECLKIIISLIVLKSIQPGVFLLYYEFYIFTTSPFVRLEVLIFLTLI